MNHRGQRKLQKKLKFPLDKPHKMCYNKCVKRRGKQKPSLAMVEQKSSKKPLDKPHRMCYNEYVKRGTHRDALPKDWWKTDTDELILNNS